MSRVWLGHKSGLYGQAMSVADYIMIDPHDMLRRKDRKYKHDSEHALYQRRFHTNNDTSVATKQRYHPGLRVHECPMSYSSK